MTTWVCESEFAGTPAGAEAFAKDRWMSTPVRQVKVLISNESGPEVGRSVARLTGGGAGPRVRVFRLEDRRALQFVAPTYAPEAAARALGGSRRLVCLTGAACADAAEALFAQGWTRGLLAVVFFRLLGPGETLEDVSAAVRALFPGPGAQTHLVYEEVDHALDYA